MGHTGRRVRALFQERTEDNGDLGASRKGETMATEFYYGGVT